MLSVLFLMTSLNLSTQQAWVWSVHPEAGFKILVPATLSHKLTGVPTSTHIIQYHQYNGGSVADTSSGLAFVIDHYILPLQEPDSDPEHLRDFFETTVDQILTALGGTLVYIDFIQRSGQELCIWKASFQEGEGVIRGHSLLAGNKYYGLQVFGLKENKPDAQMSKFLESFKLIGNTSP